MAAHNLGVCRWLRQRFPGPVPPCGHVPCDLTMRPEQPVEGAAFDIGDEPPFNPFAPPEDAPAPTSRSGEHGEAPSTAAGGVAGPGSGFFGGWPSWLIRAWAVWSTFEVVESDPSLPLEELRYRKWCAAPPWGSNRAPGRLGVCPFG